MNVFELDLQYIGSISKWLVDCDSVWFYMLVEFMLTKCVMCYFWFISSKNEDYLLISNFWYLTVPQNMIT